VPPSIVEKYEQILAADPRSRIFVELARALLDRGDARRAMEVCRAGLEHHPRSIQGRITWGRALLEAGDAKGAHDQFDVAIGIDPGTPYAYNLVGEVLVGAGLFREALPVLARAAELQPADEQARGSKQITKSIESISEMVHHLNRAQKEQTKGSEQVMSAVVQIKQVAEAQNHSARELEGAIADLAGQADVLRGEVRRFQI
jgi:tetratricopeptide (TPR) repeat protein